MVSWQVRNATAVVINNTLVGLEGTMPFHSLKPHTICIKAKNGTNKSVEQKLTIDIDRTLPVIQYYKSDKDFVIKNYPVTLSWGVTGARKIYIDNGIGDVSGRSSVITTLTGNGVYKLIAENFFGFKSESNIVITIFPRPVIEGLFIPEPQFKSESISLDVPAFNLQMIIDSKIQVAQPVFTDVIEFARLTELTTRILFMENATTSILFSNNIFKQLMKKQKEITHIIKATWKRKIRKKLKKSLQ
jgi:hypothetical protein